MDKGGIGCMYRLGRCAAKMDWVSESGYEMEE